MSIEEIYLISEKHPIVFFDGVCNLCNGFVQFVIRNDKEGKIRFCALQSDEGVRIRQELGLGADINTAVGVAQKKIYTHSDALYMVSKSMGGLWNLLLPFYCLPKTLRDTIYNWVAQNRYNWFGRRDRCIIPNESIMARFISI